MKRLRDDYLWRVALALAAFAGGSYEDVPTGVTLGLVGAAAVFILTTPVPPKR